MDPERWHKLSLEEQLGNIGSEVSRAGRWQDKDEKTFWGAVERGLELLDLTIADTRLNLAEKTEVARAREVFCDAVFGGHEYGTTFENLLPYFDQFALATRRVQGVR
ncbi:MAG: hypothetical protein AAB417_00330 [Patescibacteria group bacterium]